MLCWDESAFYLEQRFVSQRGFVHAIAIAKQSIVGGGTPATVLQLVGLGEMKSPAVPDDGVCALCCCVLLCVSCCGAAVLCSAVL